jgi:hypothetical protein
VCEHIVCGLRIYKSSAVNILYMFQSTLDTQIAFSQLNIYARTRVRNLDEVSGTTSISISISRQAPASFGHRRLLPRLLKKAVVRVDDESRGDPGDSEIPTYLYVRHPSVRWRHGGSNRVSQVLVSPSFFY